MRLPSGESAKARWVPSVTVIDIGAAACAAGTRLPVASCASASRLAPIIACAFIESAPSPSFSIRRRAGDSGV